MEHISYEIVKKHEINALCEQGKLDPILWYLGSESSIYITFYCESFVGAVELAKKREGLFIEMIEVTSENRGRGFGEILVRFLQKQCAYLECVPIESSEHLFSKCGFLKSDSSIWYWLNDT